MVKSHVTVMAKEMTLGTAGIHFWGSDHEMITSSYLTDLAYQCKVHCLSLSIIDNT
jgi:hypothetical protein